MPAPVVRRRSARSCTRTDQPRCASAQAAASPANPAPTISARRIDIGLVSGGCCGHEGVFPFRRLAMIVPRGSWERSMARLRHIAVCVRDLEKAAKFYEDVFELRRVGREDIEIGSAIYM